MNRRVIALETTLITQPEPDAPGGSYWMLRRTALCDDGTMWERYNDAWHQIENVPQPPARPPHVAACKCIQCYPEGWRV